jgi:hypothetical protein
MGFFGMLFWIAVFWFAFKAFRRWSCSGREQWHDRRTEGRVRPDDQQAYIDSLETRLAELEERLDFTERLVAGRRELAS